jgi:hypothetical protein
LEHCVVGLNKNLSPSNAWSHLRRKHSTDSCVAALLQKSDEKNKKTTSAITTAATTIKVAPMATTTTATTTTNSAGTKRKVQMQVEVVPLKKPYVIRQYEDLVVAMVNDHNCAARLVESSKFRQLISFVVTHAKDMQEAKAQIIGRHRYQKTMLRRFAVGWMHAARAMLDSIRAHYVHATGAPKAFLSFLHDIWEKDGKNKLGVSIMFVNPRKSMHSSIKMRTGSKLCVLKTTRRCLQASQSFSWL